MGALVEPLGSAKLKSSQRRVMDGNSSPTLPCMAEGLSHQEEKSMTIPQTGGESETTHANLWGSPHSQAGSLLCKRAQCVANLPGHPLSREHEAWSAILVCRERAMPWHSQTTGAHGALALALPRCHPAESSLLWAAVPICQLQRGSRETLRAALHRSAQGVQLSTSPLADHPVTHCQHAGFHP